MARRHPRKSENTTGRRPLLLQGDTRQTVLDAIKAGVPIAHAATRAGIANSTLMSWAARGRAARERADAQQPPEPDDALYVEFLDDLERARAEAAHHLVATVQKAARGGYVKSERTYTDDEGRVVREKTYADVDWRAAQFLLERLFRQEFAKSTYIDMQVLQTPGALGALGLQEVSPTPGAGSGTDEQALAMLQQRLIEARSVRDRDEDIDDLDDPIDAEVIEDTDDDQR